MRNEPQEMHGRELGGGAAMKRFTGNEEGFTLVEAMVASFIFLSVSVGVTHCLVSAIRTQWMAKNYHTGMSIARNRLQRASQMDFDSMLVLVPDAVPVGVNKFGNPDNVGPWYRQTVVTEPISNVAQIAVSVWWPGQSGGVTNSEPIEITTMRTKHFGKQFLGP